MDCHNHSSKRFSHICVAVVLATSILATTESSLRADEQAVPHVRALDASVGALIVEGAQRSPLLRSLLDRLGRSTVFVYVGYGVLPGLSGRLTLVGTGHTWRYLRVEIDCRQSKTSRIAALGHELQHAVEIADAASAVDQKSLQALYGTIGFAVDDSRLRFESAAAREAGNRVRSELSSPVVGLAAR